MGINTHREASVQEMGENRTGNYIKSKKSSSYILKNSIEPKP